MATEDAGKLAQDISSAHDCPYCKERALETVATLPVVRGDFQKTQLRVRTLAGCVPCVRRALVLSSLDASVNGWTSVGGIFLNPIFVLYGLGRAAFVMKDASRVSGLLRTAGIEGPDAPPNALTTAYRLAASLIAADNRILPEELAIAATIGKEIFPGFDEIAFIETVRQRNRLPAPGDLASLLKTQLDNDARRTVYRYLVAIATADQDVAPEERALLGAVAKNFGISGAGRGVDATA